MLQPTGSNATRSQGYVNRMMNSGGYVSAAPPRAAKRQLNGPVSDSEPAIKQERLDSGYEQAMVRPRGTVIGSIVPATSASLPRQVFSNAGMMPHRLVQILPQRMGSTTRQNNILNAVGENQWRSTFGSRSNNALRGPIVLVRPGVTVPILPHDVMSVPNAFRMPVQRLTPVFAPVASSYGSINGQYNRASNQRVIVLPRNTAAAPHQSSFPTIIHSRPTVPRNVCITGHGPVPVSVPANSTTPLVVFVSQPSTTGARIIYPGTGLASSVTTSSASHTIGPSSHQTNNSNPLAQLRAIIGKRALEKYVGPCVPPPELHMSQHSKHVCQICGDEFVTSVGLESHMNRRSMMVSFSCAACRLPTLWQQFYNPCAFEKFYRKHGVHTTSETILITALNLDTTEYQSRVETQNQQTGNAGSGNEVSLCSENTNVPTTTAADSNLSLQPAVAAVKEIYVDVEVQPETQQNKQRSEKSDKERGTVVTKKNKNGVVKPSSATKDVLPRNKLVGKVEDFSKALCHNRTVCLECSLDCRTRRELSAHFLVSAGKETLRCTDCGLTLPTACSHSAHMRLHKNQSPYVCPHCGIVFDKAESVGVFKAHVQRYCFHLMRSQSSTSASKCPWCSFCDSDETKMAQHFIDSHAAVYYKCRSCPKAFVNISAARRHSENIGHDAQKDTVRKCALCDEVFKDSAANEMESHVIEHLAPSFQCPVCQLTASRSSVVEHLRSFHPNSVLPATTCEVCGQPHSSQKELFAHISAKHIEYYESVMKCLPPDVKKSTSDGECGSQTQSETITNMSVASGEEATSVSRSDVTPSTVSTPVSSAFSIPKPASVSETEIQSSMPASEDFQCSRCQMSFSSQDMYKRHKAKHRFLEAKKARKKQAAAKSNEDPLQQVPMPKEICMRCSQTFDNAESLKWHISTVHSAPDWHLCHLCANCFSTHDQLQRHVEIQHRGKVESAHAYVCALCAESSDGTPVSFTVQGMLTKHLRNVHGVPRIAAANMARAAAPSTQTAESANDSNQVQDSPNSSSSQIEPVRRLFVAGQTAVYQCSRCNFSTEDRAEFVAHVSEHSPTVAGAVQCKECAASFTVAPALYRHLRITHRMNCDIDTYMRENGYATRCSTPDLLLSVDVQQMSPVSPPSVSSPLMSSGGRESESSKESSGKVSSTPSKADYDDDAPGECTVCYRVFMSKQLLRAHMRVHGMAFIQRTRRRLSVSPVSSASQT